MYQLVNVLWIKYIQHTWVLNCRPGLGGFNCRPGLGGFNYRPGLGGFNCRPGLGGLNCRPGLGGLNYLFVLNYSTFPT